MASPLITTVPFTAQNITIANEVASYTIPASGQYQFQCKLTGLDPDAANLTPCLNRYDADTNWIGCVGDPNRMIPKANADDTAECFAFASFFAVAEESVALSLLSSNAADTAVGGGLEVWDATAANVTAVNGTAFAGATVPLPDSGSMPLPDVLLLAAAVYGLNVSGAAAQYLYCTGIDAHGHLTFSSVQPGQVGPGGSSTLTANSAGTLWTLTETGGSAGPWTNATLFGQYNDGGSPPTSCGVTIAPPALQRFQPTTQPQVDEDGYTLAQDETDAALLSQSYATTTGVKASNLPGDYFNNTEQSELAAAAAICTAPRGGDRHGRGRRHPGDAGEQAGNGHQRRRRAGLGGAERAGRGRRHFSAQRRDHRRADRRGHPGDAGQQAGHRRQRQRGAGLRRAKRTFRGRAPSRRPAPRPSPPPWRGPCPRSARSRTPAPSAAPFRPAS